MYIPKESENFINKEHIYSHYINRINNNNELIKDPNVKHQHEFPENFNYFGSKPEENKEPAEETEQDGGVCLSYIYLYIFYCYNISIVY